MITPSYLTLGCTDLARQRAFYEALGFSVHTEAQGSVVCFTLGALTLALFPAEALAQEIGVPSLASGTSRTLISLNVRDAQEVSRWLDRAARAGATLTRAAQEASWGGVRGYFLDPEGNPWEIAFNPKRAD